MSYIKKMVGMLSGPKDAPCGAQVLPKTAVSRQARGEFMKRIVGKRKRDSNEVVPRKGGAQSELPSGARAQRSDQEVVSPVVAPGPGPVPSLVEGRQNREEVEKDAPAAVVVHMTTAEPSSVPAVESSPGRTSDVAERNVNATARVVTEAGVGSSRPCDSGRNPLVVPKVSIVEDRGGFSVLRYPFRPGSSVLKDRSTTARQLRQVRLPADRVITGEASLRDTIYNALHFTAGCEAWVAKVVERLINQEEYIKQLERENKSMCEDLDKVVAERMAVEMTKLEVAHMQEKVLADAREQKLSAEKKNLDLVVRRLEADMGEQKRSYEGRIRELNEKLSSSESLLNECTIRLDKTNAELCTANADLEKSKSENEKLKMAVEASDKQVMELKGEVECLKGEVSSVIESSRAQHIADFKASAEYTDSLEGLFDECTERGFYFFKRALKQRCPVVELDDLCWSDETLEMCYKLPLASGEPVFVSSTAEDDHSVEIVSVPDTCVVPAEGAVVEKDVPGTEVVITEDAVAEAVVP